MIVLMYHSIAATPGNGKYSVTPGQFAAQMLWLQRNGLNVKTLRECPGDRDLLSRGDTVVVTFDDGYEDNHREAFPVLQRCGFVGTFFIATDFVGGSNDWETASEPTPMMSWGQIKALADAGMEIGSHTASHLDVRTASIEAMATELSRSRDAIAANASSAVTSFAYPYGYCRPEMPALLAEAGYTHAVLAGTYGTNSADTPCFELHRIPIWGGDSLRTFAGKIRGHYRWRYYTRKLAVESRWCLSRLTRKR
jgi:peptidoglycan/xylan/chitin deacetylase (PgdA/CDA1 family)